MFPRTMAMRFKRRPCRFRAGRCRPIPPRAARCAQQMARFPLRGRAPVVTAVSENAKRPTIYSYGTGGIFLDAGVSAENTAGGRPFEGVDKTEGVSDAITLGANCEAVGVKVHTVPEAPATTTPGRALLVCAGGWRAGAGQGDGVPPCMGRPGLGLGRGLFCSRCHLCVRKRCGPHAHRAGHGDKRNARRQHGLYRCGHI